MTEQKSDSYNLTSEQKKIIEYEPFPSQIFKIIAFAGTGKTTTLIEYAKARPNKSFLYVAFNKSVQLEAAKKFSNNVICRTAHSLAFAKKGYKYKNCLVASIRPYQIISFFGLPSDEYNVAKFILDTFNNYLASNNESINRNHIPLDFYEKYNEEKSLEIIDFTIKLTNYMMGEDHKEIGVIHDLYLKEYQLSNPILTYDYIFLDEAQDMNPVIADIVLQQIKTDDPPAIIMVGDNHQQIYSFRGAKGILSKTQAFKTMFLTQSFRFNTNIGKIASMLLKYFKNERKNIRGIERKSKPSWNKNQYTIISRTNAILFDHAVKLIKNNKIGFIGSLEEHRFSLMNDISSLMYNQNNIEDNFIKNFKTYEDLKEYASKAEDVEIKSMCIVVEKYGKLLPELMQTILNEHVAINKCEITLTTAHKAKGLEWNNVYLSNDFICLIKEGELCTLKEKDKDEINLLYVAVTRAIHNLRIDSENSLVNFIKVAKNMEINKKN